MFNIYINLYFLFIHIEFIINLKIEILKNLILKI